MRAPAPRNARACTALDGRQPREPRSCALTAHSTPANFLPRANLDAQGGSGFLSVIRIPGTRGP